MTPKEKAEELVYKFMDTRIPWKQSKLCALTAVDEILNHHHQSQGLYRIDSYFWQEVKQEIEKI
jgi:hypothetical protein